MSFFGNSIIEIPPGIENAIETKPNLHSVLHSVFSQKAPILREDEWNFLRALVPLDLPPCNPPFFRDSIIEVPQQTNDNYDDEDDDDEMRPTFRSSAAFSEKFQGNTRPLL
eukprot:TRINITY_DN18177_c0_g1_i1.p1 TRINITY_DN18177_c0_g1~~TRINITY_DN18177_c0_g1_i1.p1  ORF type:complete len:111 (-),score=23.14 TRINITY_DN18177_c0_g1_i1:23-355(-)